MQPIILISLLILIITFLPMPSVNGAPIQPKKVINNQARSKKAVIPIVQSRKSRQLADLGKSQSLGTGSSTAIVSSPPTTRRKPASTTATSRTTSRKAPSTTAKRKLNAAKPTPINRQKRVSLWDWQ